MFKDMWRLWGHLNRARKNYTSRLITNHSVGHFMVSTYHSNKKLRVITHVQSHVLKLCVKLSETIMNCPSIGELSHRIHPWGFSKISRLMEFESTNLWFIPWSTPLNTLTWSPGRRDATGAQWWRGAEVANAGRGSYQSVDGLWSFEDMLVINAGWWWLIGQ